MYVPAFTGAVARRPSVYTWKNPAHPADRDDDRDIAGKHLHRLACTHLLLQLGRRYGEFRGAAALGEGGDSHPIEHVGIRRVDVAAEHDLSPRFDRYVEILFHTIELSRLRAGAQQEDHEPGPGNRRVIGIPQPTAHQE